MARIVTISGGQISRAGERAATKGDKVYANMDVGAAAWVRSGKEVRVKSSNVYSIRYQTAGGQLFVAFRRYKSTAKGPTYRYSNVPTRVAKEMYDAPSMGKFVWRRLRDKYPYSIVS